MSRFWNEKRIQNYPRLIFIGIWIVMIFNILLHQGWSGGFGGVIGVDFISAYSGGIIYRNDIDQLYSIQTQYEIQQGIFQQEAYVGQYNTFVYPPYVGFLYAVFTYLPIQYAILVWTLLSILAGLFSVYLIEKHLIPSNIKSQITFFQLTIILFGFPPTVLGLMFGQTHLITFFLLTVVVVLSQKGHWLPAGLLLGFLIYKPQLVIGFLLLFLLRKRIKALVGFGVTTAVLVAVVFLQHGIQPFINFINFTSVFIANYYELLMFEVGVFTLVTSALYGWIRNYVHSIMPYWIVASSIILGWVFLNKRVKASQYTDYILAILFIFVVSPHVLITDMLPMILIIILLANEKPSPKLVFLSSLLFLFTIIFAILSRYVGISLLGLIPVYLCYLVVRNLVLPPKDNPAELRLV